MRGAPRRLVTPMFLAGDRVGIPDNGAHHGLAARKVTLVDFSQAIVSFALHATGTPRPIRLVIQLSQLRCTIASSALISPQPYRAAEEARR